MTAISYRPAKLKDAESLGTIIFDAFFKISTEHRFPPDFASAAEGIWIAEMMLSTPGIYSVVAENGRVLGSNFLWESDEVDGVGPITVDPAEQNASIGRRLMEDVIARSDKNRKVAIRLVQAAYHNRSLALYSKLGFDAVEPLSCISGTPVNADIPGRVVRPMKDSDVDEADKLCVAVHGISRKNEIESSVVRGSADVVEVDGRVTGYTTQLGMFGHTVAASNDDLKALIGSGREIAGVGFLLPTRNAEVLRWCLENGLKIVQPLTLMSRGFYQEPRGAFMPSILY